jgi:hypothetical protein
VRGRRRSWRALPSVVTTTVTVATTGRTGGWASSNSGLNEDPIARAERQASLAISVDGLFGREKLRNSVGVDQC